MCARRRKSDADLTRQFLSGELEEEAPEQVQRFSKRSRHAVQRKVERTAALRAAEEEFEGNVEALPVGQVLQVYSLFSEVEHEGTMYLCVVRKTLAKLMDSPIVVGDVVRFRPIGSLDEQQRPDAVIEQVLPRRSVLTRAASFRGVVQQPIVANADQMLIVASLMLPKVKWGLVDRMLIAAQSGKLAPVVCLNKVDLAESSAEAHLLMNEADTVLGHYEKLGVATLRTSVTAGAGVDVLRETLRDKISVLAGHSGVGKSSLINAIQPQLKIRIGLVSAYTAKGIHTTTSARRYALDFGGAVVDTPGVKHFGLWGVTADNLIDYFPDVANDWAPTWRLASYKRILASLPGERLEQ